ncbi:MAG: DEAD/DEAH box helicase, partial [Calditrichaeota bacterium]
KLEDPAERNGTSDLLLVDEGIEGDAERGEGDLLIEEADLLKIRLQFLYGDTVVSYEDERPRHIFAREKRIIQIIRDREAEEEAAAIFSELRVRRVKYEGWSVPDSRAVKWLFTHIPLFFEKGYTILGQDQLKRYRVRTGTPQIRVNLSSDLDWFDVQLDVQIEGIKVSLKELMKSIRTHSAIVKLIDNSLAQLPEDWHTKFSHLFHFSRHEESSIKVAHVHAVMLEHLFEDVPLETSDATFAEQVKRLADFEGIAEQPMPQGLQGILRPYQKAGYDWLFFLQRYRFGGCLADDMGLGKTIQALALLLYGKENGVQTPSLIVCPTSVVFNWEQEIAKFAPQLIAITHTGQNREREGEPFKGVDVVLTTYGVMLRDYPFLQQTTFHYVILDEAQKIKNPLSQTSGVVRLLHSDHRLALTGTPVENGTIELWSLFAFLNPGLLGSVHYFRKAFALQIEKYGDTQAAGLLQKMIFPFILRRTKENVAPELPPKMEQIFWCEQTPQQKELYERWRDFYRAKILKQIDEQGLDQSRMNVLEGLLRLRQIACHPNLVEVNGDGDSGKFDALIDLVEEIVQGGHKLLLFSQFVKMLDIIRPRLEASGIVYEYLDGSTKNRKERVQRFQNDASIKAFLISLKAGGAGLNLTAADYVIHYDPWWNPAVEQQASDRTHRIGQDKNVFIYKLITRGTVEEKILTLQERKAKLVKDLITVEGGILKMLGREEIEALFS